jgi:DNA-binding transcriptional LysR family regulator
MGEESAAAARFKKACECAVMWEKVCPTMKASRKSGTPLDARQLNAFVTLVEAGSFTEAARRLSLTQSAISHSLRALEVETGCRLLARIGNIVTPSEAGEALLYHARLGLKEFSKARDALEQLKSWGVRRLRVGGNSFINQRFLPQVLVDLRQLYSRLVVSVKTARPDRDAEALRKGELDCLICEEPFPVQDLEFTRLFQSAMRVVVPAKHRWASRRQIPLAEMAREPWLLPERPSPTRDLIERYYLRDKTSLNAVADVENIETILELVKAGFGVAILPHWAIGDEAAAETVHTLPTGARELHQSWGYLRWRQRPVDAFEHNFRRLCAKAGKKFAK